MYYDQENAEIAEALRVQALTGAERFAWLKNVWGKVQSDSNAFLINAPVHQPKARSYAALEKNRFDEVRKLEFALRHSIYATRKLP